MLRTKPPRDLPTDPGFSGDARVEYGGMEGCYNPNLWCFLGLESPWTSSKYVELIKPNVNLEVFSRTEFDFCPRPFNPKIGMSSVPMTWWSNWGTWGTLQGWFPWWSRLPEDGGTTRWSSKMAREVSPETRNTSCVFDARCGNIRGLSYSTSFNHVHIQ